MTHEEEEEKLRRFKELGERLNEQEMSLTEYIDRMSTDDEMFNDFFMGYTTGVSIKSFPNLSLSEQAITIYLLEIGMIMSRKLGNMDKYDRLKEVISELETLRKR